MTKHRYNFFLDEEHLRDLKAIAHEERTTVSEIIRLAIEQRLNDQIHTDGRSDDDPTDNDLADLR